MHIELAKASSRFNDTLLKPPEACIICIIQLLKSPTFPRIFGTNCASCSKNLYVIYNYILEQNCIFFRTTTRQGLKKNTF